MNKDYSDYMIRGMAADMQIRCFAATTRNLTEYARVAHNTSPIVTAALGRLMTGTVMMGNMLKGDNDLLTVKVDGDGPIKGILATADRFGNVKGYAKNPGVILPPNAVNHLNVGGAVGKGTLTVIRDLGLKDPYVGQVELHSGEIADDMTYYFAESEQIPSSVGLGVLMNKNNTVSQAGGFIIQLMPFAAEETIEKLEQNLSKVKSVTDILREGHSPEEMLRIILEGFDVSFDEAERMPVQFKCECDRDRVSRALILLGKRELDDMINDGKEIELKCQFCGKAYTFSVEELKKLKDETTVK